MTSSDFTISDKSPHSSAGSGTRVVANGTQHLAFAKMHGAGNDFIVFDGRYILEPRSAGNIDLTAFAKAACDRRFGIGADGIIALGVSDKADYRMTYLNADGSPAICGNGLRCLAKFIVSRSLHQGKKQLEIETDTSIVKVDIIGRGDWFRVDMGPPFFEGLQIPTAEPGRHLRRELEAAGIKVHVTAVGMGNPHCVIFVDDLTKVPFETLGPALENHPFFPQRTNVEFVQPHSKSRLQVRVWERGCGETLACGTGACSVMAAAAQTGRSGRSAQLDFKGGSFYASWSEETNRISLTGPAEEVCQGTVDVARLLAAEQERLQATVPAFVTSALAAAESR
jgi:diaminopimelate epimerase